MIGAMSGGTGRWWRRVLGERRPSEELPAQRAAASAEAAAVSGRDAVLVFSRELYPLARRGVQRLVDTAPGWAEVFVVGFDPERPGEYDVELATGSLRHRVYGWEDVDSLGLPVKARAKDGTLNFVPGNMDWLLYLFDRDHPGYERLWWVEDDVRFGGPWSVLLDELRVRPEGLIAPRRRSREDAPEWFWWQYASYPEGVRQLATFHPFGRVTHAALEALLQAYRDGWKGHHETFLPTVVEAAGLGVYDPVDRYTVDTFRHRPFHRPPVPQDGRLWHPVRGARDREQHREAKRRQRMARLELDGGTAD